MDVNRALIIHFVDIMTATSFRKQLSELALEFCSIPEERLR